AGNAPPAVHQGGDGIADRDFFPAPVRQDFLNLGNPLPRGERAEGGKLIGSILIHDYCMSKGIPVWHGGMLESGIGRAGNVALASLPNFTLPGDISASSRYYTEDIVEPAFYVNSDGTMDVPQGAGIGVEVDRKRLDNVTIRMAAWKAG
ncbi:MAG: enolase C-terminal domain-like protein, partial [Bacteroidales bacterium]|nr:enolase C-terminal domain-like protein [Bacteroidales bacterium]